jgi:pimeloyl-ACP methyl ester carboxylesterase
MLPDPTTLDQHAASPIRFAGLAGRLHGDPDTRATPIVLLHGLTFDRRMWNPVMAALPADRAVLVLDLPGHGGSPGIAGRGLAPVVGAIHAAVADAGLERPVIAGHSISGPIASIYASEHDVAGVVSIDAPLRFEGFAASLRAVATLLAGPGFEEGWQPFRDSFGLPLLTPQQRELVRAGDHPSGAVILQYQADLLERPVDEVVRWRDGAIARVRDRGTPYVALFANDIEPADRAWLRERLPQAEILVWPVRHHFPHMTEPERFARLLGKTAATADVEVR